MYSINKILHIYYVFLSNYNFFLAHLRLYNSPTYYSKIIKDSNKGKVIKKLHKNELIKNRGESQLKESEGFRVSGFVH